MRKVLAGQDMVLADCEVWFGSKVIDLLATYSL